MFCLVVSLKEKAELWCCVTYAWWEPVQKQQNVLSPASLHVLSYQLLDQTMQDVALCLLQPQPETCKSKHVPSSVPPPRNIFCMYSLICIKDRFQNVLHTSTLLRVFLKGCFPWKSFVRYERHDFFIILKVTSDTAFWYDTCDLSRSKWFSCIGFDHWTEGYLK
jgi:hypothetical protein